MCLYWPPLLLCRHPNVLILTTSNLSGTVDVAFVDRADMKQFIGLPTQPAIYQIYRSCITELDKVRWQLTFSLLTRRFHSLQFSKWCSIPLIPVPLLDADCEIMFSKWCVSFHSYQYRCWMLTVKLCSVSGKFHTTHTSTAARCWLWNYVQ